MVVRKELVELVDIGLVKEEANGKKDSGSFWILNFGIHFSAARLVLLVISHIVLHSVMIDFLNLCQIEVENLRERTPTSQDVRYAR